MAQSDHYKYFTFPVTLLHDASEDMYKVCQNVINYSVYDYARNAGGSEATATALAAEFFGIASPKTAYRDGAYHNGQKIYDRTPPGTPKVSLKTDLIWDFNYTPRDEFETVVFLAFAGLRSVLGGKTYSKTNNAFMLSRMAGFSKPGNPLPEVLEKYNNRYQLDRIKNELRQNWKLQIYGRHTQGFYFSFKLDLKQLVLEAETKRKTYKQKQMKDEQKEAYNAAIATLYGKDKQQQQDNTTTTP